MATPRNTDFSDTENFHDAEPHLRVDLDAFDAAEMAGLRAFARAVLASATREDPSCVAFLLECNAEKVRLELIDVHGNAVGGYEL